ncbi:MAG: hypothetical protein H6Q05_5002, partial [Acidobacteria bacterium]|nr:hypothetical protein [Acidobacteriota bacterium]
IWQNDYWHRDVILFVLQKRFEAGINDKLVNVWDVPDCLVVAAFRIFELLHGLFESFL